MKRALALLAAIGLVAGAVLVRGALDGDGGGTTAALTMWCAPIIAEACREIADEVDGLAVEVRSDADTAAAVASGETTLDDATVWLQVGPWAEMFAAGTEMPAVATGAPVAHADVVLAADSQRLTELDGCGSPPWTCTPELPTGRSARLPSTADGDGLVATAQAVSANFGTTDWSLNDLQDDEQWFSSLAAAARSNDSGEQLVDDLVVVRGKYSWVGALSSQTATLDSAQAGGRYAARPQEPATAAEVILVAGSDADVAGALDRLGAGRLTDGLLARGWTAGAAPGGAGLPSAGALYAMWNTWENGA